MASRLTWRGRGWNLSAAALHARLDARAAARDAYDYTRTGGFLARGWRRLWLWFGSHSVDPQVSFAEPLTRERLDTISQAVDVKPVQGAVTIGGTQPRVRQAKDGRAVDRAAVLRLLGAAVISGDRVTAALPVVAVTPDVSTADAQAAAATARAWLSGSLALTHGGHAWTIRSRSSVSTSPSCRRTAARACA